MHFTPFRNTCSLLLPPPMSHPPRPDLSQRVVGLSVAPLGHYFPALSILQPQGQRLPEAASRLSRGRWEEANSPPWSVQSQYWVSDSVGKVGNSPPQAPGDPWRILRDPTTGNPDAPLHRHACWSGDPAKHDSARAWGAQAAGEERTQQDFKRWMQLAG